MADRGKSFLTQKNDDPRTFYCIGHSIIQGNELLDEIVTATLKSCGDDSIMLGAPEVLQFCGQLIQLIGGKRCLDIGTFTGESAVSWSLVIPSFAEGGQVITMDVDRSRFDAVARPILSSKRPDLSTKIDLRICPASKTLEELLSSNEASKFDFAFLDADKVNYDDYYEKCLKLIRPGGIIAVDNALAFGTVYGAQSDGSFSTEETKAIDELNKKIQQDSRVNSTLLSIGDGLHLAFVK